MRAFQTALMPSKTALMAVQILHLAAVAAAAVYFYGWMCWLGTAGFTAGWLWAVKRHRLAHDRAVHKITVSRQGQVAVFYAADQMAFEAVLLEDSVVLPYAMFLHWDAGDRKIWHYVLPDMTDRESYRRLLVWARWGQSAV
ncbi:protein YgfX [Neisseria weaveri]|uniref:protein YgfX n=1 Tax=Neisseria weaveri TaxID=28091 RepID=UPI000D31968B|nr:protein YgfX [Neisseria weaveri]